jgi:uncharacterized hydrophobic protein (TIGR00271 family)
MHALQVYAPSASAAGVLELLNAQAGVDHVVRVGDTTRGDMVLITADVEAPAVDSVLPKLASSGVSGDEISIIHRDADRPLGTPRAGDMPSWSGGPLAWTELALASRQYARAVPQYLTFMGGAGIIAAFGVLTSNTILIVGAMAISPDLLPLCATCVGLVDRRPRLAGRAFAALLIGLATAGTTAFVATALLRLTGYPNAQRSVGSGGLGTLPTVNVATIVVAFVAGIVGILAFETKSGSAVGVAISITTIPAVSFAGVAIAVHDPLGARGALGVLAANVAMLLAAGTLTLWLQRRYRR